MLSPLILAAIVLLLVSSASAALLVRDVAGGRLRERVSSIRVRTDDGPSTPVPTVALRSTGQRGAFTAKFMRLLRLNPDIALQNVIPWKLVIVVSCAAALGGLFYGHEFLGWWLAALLMPVDAVFVARLIFGWERAAYQKTLLEQIPDVMALICRAVAAGIPLGEALRNVSRDASSPSREEFMRVVNEVSIGQPLEAALWKLHDRVDLPEYAFFAVTIGLQAQTGGSLVETLQNLQDLVRRRVALSKRGKALAAEARMSAMILAVLPFLAFIGLSFIQDGFVHFFFGTPTGNHLLMAAFGFLSGGIFVMRQLIRRSLKP
jgi:tight adherence protein B